MLFWITAVTLLMLLIFLLDSRLIVVVWIILSLLAAFRYNVGTDYASYARMYSEITSGTATGAWLVKEKGYVLIIQIAHFLGANFQLVCATMSFATIFLMYHGLKYFIKDKPYYIIFATVLFIPFIYIYALNFIRQALAAAIFLYSSRYIVDKKFIKYCFSIFLAFLFHRSVIILIPMYWLLNIHYSKKVIIIFIISCLTFLIINPIDIMSQIFQHFGFLYAGYFTSDTLNDPTSKLGALFTFSNIAIFLLLVPLIDSTNRTNRIVINAVMIFILIRVISIDFKPFNRIASYFNPFFMLFVIYTADKIWNKVKYAKLLFAFIFLISWMSLTFGYLAYLSNKDGSYNQYAYNVCIVGEPCPVQIYGNYKNMYFEVGK